MDWSRPGKRSKWLNRVLAILAILSLMLSPLLAAGPVAAQDSPTGSGAGEGQPAPAATESIPEPPKGWASSNESAAAAGGTDSTGWSKVSGSLGDVRWLVVIQTSPNYVFASVDGYGIFISQDAGQSWNPMPTAGLNDKGIQSFAVCPSGNIFAGTWGSGVFRLAFQATEWAPMNNGLTQKYVSAVSCDAQNTVLVGTYDQGVFRSTDAGLSWVPANTGIRTGANDRRILTLFAVPGIVGLGTVNGAYVSYDGGKTWNPAGLIGYGVYDFTYDRAGSSEIWAGTNSGGVFSTKDGGETWKALGGPSSIYSVSQGSDLSLYAGTRDSGVYRYEGGQWVFDGLGEAGRKVYVLRLAAYNRLLAGTNDGLWAAVTVPRTPTPVPTDTPLPTDTPTPTDTATPTNTPVGPRVALSMWSIPDGPINMGEEISYYIDYQVVGESIASNVVITNAIPSNVDLVPGSISPADKATVSGRVISWSLGDISVGTAGTVSYKVVAPFPTPTPTASLTPTPTNTLTATQGPSPTPTKTGTATPTGTPTATDAWTPTATPTPTNTATQTGPATACSTGKVEGYVYQDTNGNTVRDPSEAGLSGVTVRLRKNGSEIRTTTTASSGYYQFTGLQLGGYEVAYDLPAGYSATVPTTKVVTLAGCSEITNFGTRACELVGSAVAPSSSGSIALDPAPNCEGGTNGQNLYNYGTQVRFQANPATGYQFVDWSGDLTGAANPSTLSLDADKSVTANFTACFPLTTNVPVSGSGTISASVPPNCQGGGTNLYNPGTVVDLTASPASDWSFKNWSGDVSGTANPSTVTMSAARSITANFEACVAASTAVNPTNGGSSSVTSSPNCQGGTKYKPNTQVDITTSAASSYFIFKNWTTTSGSLGSAGAQSTSLTLGTADANATANYDECRTLTTGAYPAEDGSVSVKTQPNCGGDRYLPNTAVTLEAVPITGKTFQQWSGDVPAADQQQNPVTITMDANKSVTALFDIACFTLATSISPASSGSVSASPAPNCSTDASKYTYGTNVSLTASPASGYKFNGWTGDATGATSPVTISMTGNKSVTGNFTACFALTTQVSPAGGGSVGRDPAPNCQGGGTNMYSPGTVVNLTASPAVDYAFGNWTGPVSSSTANPTSVTMDAAKTVTANFQGCVSVSASTSGGTGASAKVDTTANCPGGGSKFAPNSTLNISTSSTSSYDVFGQWTTTGGSLTSPTSPNATLTLGQASVTVTANYDTCKILSAAPNPASAGSVSKSPAPNCGGDRYLPGTTVSLTGNPATGYVFDHWSGDATGSANPTNLTMNADKSVQANFIDACFTLSTSVSPATSGTVAADVAPNCTTASGMYKYGTVVKLTASPANDYAFDYWSGDVPPDQDPRNNPVTITIDGNKSLIARFAGCFTLTTSSSPLGGGSVAASPGANCQGGTKYKPSTVVQLTANPATDYAFSSWSGDATGTANPTNLTMNADKSVQANFIDACFTLSTSVSPADSGTVAVDVAPNCTTASGKYKFGTVVMLTASPANNYAFDSWTGSIPADQEPADNPLTVTIDGNKSLAARFAGCYTLTTSSSPSGGGSVAASPGANCQGGTKYKPGTAVQLTASAATDYAFSSWSGDASGTSNPVSVAMNANKTVAANFQACVAILMAASPVDGGSVSIGAASCEGGGSKYQPGVAVAISASPAAGFNFGNWTATAGTVADGSSSATTYTPSTSAATLTANFVPAAAPVAGQPSSAPLDLYLPIPGRISGPASADAGSITVINRGAYAYWSIAGARQVSRSNIVINGQLRRIYLPVIRR